MDITVESIDQPGQDPISAPSVTDSVQHLAIADRYGIVNANTQENEKLQTLWDYAKSKAQSEDIQEVIWQVINLENTLGAPRIGEQRLDRLYKYIRLRKQEANIQREIQDVSLGAYLRRNG
jgi:uncharacterized protein YeeX (DUF496 family)